ncbi:hypothetical protein [Agrococcus sp. ProA11]|uniref:hypothetical protein n=1 Tax=Agrococcus chionoecetis TaxID=3153752 RepID=UPI003260D1D5
MAVWDDIASSVEDPAALQRLEPLLARLDDEPEDIVDSNGDPWRVWEDDLGGDDPLTIVPSRSAVGPGGADDGVLVMPDPTVNVRVALALDAPGGDPDGGIRVTLRTPGLLFRPPRLVPALLDSRGQLRPDPSKQHVEFRLPRVRIRIERPADGAFSTRMLGASTDDDDPGPERLYEFIQMVPPYALSGPDATFGFAFRSAVLDMSETETPSSPGADVISLPDDWQGLWLPEARIFVAPDGLQGIAVSAGVRDLYVGIGDSDGLSGEFQVEVVNRGGAPTLGLRIHTPNGELIPIAADATSAEAPAGSTIVADANGGLAPHTYQLVIGGTAVSGDRAPLGSLATPASVSATVNDAGAHTTTRALTVSLRTAARPGDGEPAPSTNPATITRPPAAEVVIRIARQTATEVVLHAPAAHGELTWTTPAGSQTTAAGGEVTVAVAPGASSVAVSVSERVVGVEVREDCFFTFASPRANETATATALATYQRDAGNTSQQAQLGQRGSLTAPFFRDGAATRFARYPGVAWVIDGFASYEGRPEQRDYNRALSERRMAVLQAMLADLGITNVALGTAHGHDRAVTPAAGEPPSGSGEWRRATASTTTADVTLSGSATLDRPASPTPVTPDVDPVPQEPGRPDCFRKIGVRVRIEQDIFTRLEIYGEFDIETATEGRLPAASNDLPPNPSDGIVSFLIGLKLAADRSSWEVRGEFRGDDADLDGLVRWSDANGDDTALNILGGVAIMAPLMAIATPPTADGTDLVPMVLIGAAAGALGASGVLKTHSLILRGVELVVADTLIDATDATGPTRTTITLLFDIETAFSFDAGIIEIDPAKPVTTRYKAIGVRAGWDEVDDGSGGVDYAPVPVFDASRGYTLDIPAGSMSATPPLDELLRILGVQVSRSNPAYLELEVALGIDLGVISVDSARVRILLDTPTDIELTKLAASIEIPGALHGKGSVSIDEHGFSGALDITLTSINLRAAATITVSTHPTDGYTGVLVGAEVEFPVPLVLGGSGLGIFGFSGGVAINYTRNSGSEPTAALQWVHRQLAGDGVMDGSGWTLDSGTFAIAAGMLVGTLEGGFLMHLKGMLMIEIPGPRLLLIMKADVIKAPPALGATQSATFLAVLDLDVVRGTITIAIVAEYTIERILQIRVPVTAFFPTKGDTRHWFIDLGSFDDPITVAVLDAFEGTGYLMIHGAGLTHPNLGVTTTGLTVTAGFHLRAVLMGSKSIGLYLEATAGFDVLLAFEPVFLAGRIYVTGELRLFIISIGASAELQIRVGQEDPAQPDQTTFVFGEVCGKVDFFFFSVKGCVSLEIGHQPTLPPAPDLVLGVSLVGRGPALIEGDGAERIIDGKLGVAVAGDGSAVPVADRLQVPIDAIPVIAFSATPDLEPGGTVLGTAPVGPSSAGFTGGWVKRGDLWVRYRVTSVTLLEGSTTFDPDGQQTPSAWWAQSPPDPSLVDSLALLSWIPNATPHALPYGETLVEGLTREWDVCTPAAPPAESLWTFDRQRLGPDATGWHLRGLSWPDPADTQEPQRTRVDLHVTEPWRTGHAVADLLGPSPGRIVGDAVGCASEEAIPPSLQAWGDDIRASRAAGLEQPLGREDLAEALAAGASLLDAVAAVTDLGWDPQLNPEVGGCEGRILEAPLGLDDDPSVAGPASDRSVVVEAWEQARHEPNALRNAVRITPTSALTTMSVMLLVPDRQLAAGSLTIRRLKADGSELDATAVTQAHRVGAGATVPTTWWDPNLGPWADPVSRAGRAAARIAQSRPADEKGRFALVFVELPDAGETAMVDIGWQRAVAPSASPFFVIALAGLTLAERERHTRQSDYLAERRAAVETTLTQDPSDHALLRPGRSYTVRVAWQSQTVEQPERPGDVPGAWDPGAPAEYTFWTVERDARPADLSPWLLATAPTTGEHGVLCTQPVRLALSSQSVTRLFAAHGRTLQVRVRAASGSHPPPPGGAADDLVLIPMDPGGIRRALSPAVDVSSAFHKGLREVADALPCVDPGPAPDREEIFIPYHFDPLTEYLIDVFAVPDGATTVTDDDRVHRISFTTSRFDTVGELAALVRFGPTSDIALTNPSALDSLTDRPSGAELDEAFLAAGLDAPTVPRVSSTTVAWGVRGGVMEPIAVIIESNETLWRSRSQPVEQHADADSEDPRHTWWVRTPTDWMTVETSGDAAVRRRIRGPGDTRLVVLLEPGQRGKTLSIDLVVPADPFWRSPDSPGDGDEQRSPMASFVLSQPIWEVED